MYQQEVKGKKTSPLVGIGMIALIVLSISAAGILEQALARFTGIGFGSMLVWALVVLEVFLLLRMNVREYRYTLTEGRFFIETRYGNNVRVIHDIPVKTMLAVGAQTNVFAEYGNGQAYDKVFTKGCALPASALAYKKNGDTRLLVFQPDEKMLDLLRKGIEK